LRRGSGGCPPMQREGRELTGLLEDHLCEGCYGVLGYGQANVSFCEPQPRAGGSCQFEYAGQEGSPKGRGAAGLGKVNSTRAGLPSSSAICPSNMNLSARPCVQHFTWQGKLTFEAVYHTAALRLCRTGTHPALSSARAHHTRAPALRPSRVRWTDLLREGLFTRQVRLGHTDMFGPAKE